MSEINESLIEAPLKALLEDVLFCLEGYLEGQSDLKLIENQLKDYDTLPGLVKIIANVFKTLMKKIDKKISLLKLNPNDIVNQQDSIITVLIGAIMQKRSMKNQNRLYKNMKPRSEDTLASNNSLNFITTACCRRQKTQKSPKKKQQNNQIKKFMPQKRISENPQRAIDSQQRRMNNQENQQITNIQCIQIVKSTFCHSDHKLKRADYSSEYPGSIANLYPQNSMRHSTPLKSQSQHHKCGKFNNQIQHRSTQEQDLFIKYNKLLKQHAQSITQRSQIIQASQYLLKGGFGNNTKKIRNTLNVISDICNAQQQKSSQRNKSQGNSSKTAGANSQNPVISNNKSGPHKITSETLKTNEAIQRLLKLK